MNGYRGRVIIKDANTIGRPPLRVAATAAALLWRCFAFGATWVAETAFRACSESSNRCHPARARTSRTSSANVSGGLSCSISFGNLSGCPRRRWAKLSRAHRKAKKRCLSAKISLTQSDPAPAEREPRARARMAMGKSRRRSPLKPG
jgi:hypothetical protein